jgi:DNA-binding transcriptional LysR family regulator
LNLNYMQYFVCAVDRASLSAAAEDLFITPQGLSQALQRLENEYNTKLFYRDGNAIRPTKAGEKVYDVFCRIIALNDDIKEDLEVQGFSNSADSKDTLTVFSPPILTSTVLTNVVPVFCKRNPRVRLRIIEIPSRDLHNAMDDPKNMICLFGTTPANVDAFSRRFPELPERHPLYRTKILACVPKRSPLSVKSEITGLDFADRDVVLCRNEEFFLRALYPKYSMSQVVMRSQNKALCFAVIAENSNTVGFSNSAELYYCNHKSLTYIPITPTIEVVYGYLTSSEGIKNPTIVNFKKLVEAEFAKIRQYDPLA